MVFAIYRWNPPLPRFVLLTYLIYDKIHVQELNDYNFVFMIYLLLITHEMDQNLKYPPVNVLFRSTSLDY